MGPTTSGSRVRAVAEEDLVGDAAAVFSEMRSMGAPVPELYGVLAHAPSQLRAWHGFASGMREPSGLPVATELLVVLRVAHILGSDRQWRHQVTRAPSAGLSERQAAAVRAADLRHEDVFDEQQLAALDLAGVIAAGVAVDARTYAVALDLLGIEHLIAVALKATYFRSLASLLLTFDLT